MEFQDTPFFTTPIPKQGPNEAQLDLIFSSQIAVPNSCDSLITIAIRIVILILIGLARLMKVHGPQRHLALFLGWGWYRRGYLKSL